MKKRSTFNILYYLNTSKRKKSGMCPVMGRITVDGGIASFSLHAHADPASWDVSAGRVRGKSRGATALNRRIDRTDQSVRDIYRRILESSGYVTAEQIKNGLSGAGNKAANLLQLFREHNAEYEKRVGIDRKAGSFRAYKSSFHHMERFIREKYGREDIPLKQLDMPFISGYSLYLRADRCLKVNSAMRHVIILKKLATRAIRQETLHRDPFPDHVPDRPEHRYRHIREEELDRLLSTRIGNERICFVRDLFVFSCFTGLARSDIQRLGEKHLRKEPDGLWIDVCRQKTGVESNIPLLDIPLRIIEKYRPQRKSGLLFNIPCNSTVDRMLHRVAQLCGIKHLTFHMARHTFATQVCLAQGVSMETTGKMMGHSSIHSTQIYAEITNQKVAADMSRLAGRINGEWSADS